MSKTSMDTASKRVPKGRLRLLIILGLLAVGILVVILASCNPGPIFYANEESTPIANGKVRVLCYDTQSLEAVSDEQLDSVLENSNVFTVTTNTDGRFKEIISSNGTSSRKWPNDCNYVMALHQEYIYETGAEKPEHGPSYIVFSTNWTPNNEKPQSIDDPIIIYNDEDHRLILFNVVVSIAWQAPQTYVEELRVGLKKASGLLYDLTDGQMAFAWPSIYLNGNQWNSADIRVLAANDYRPTAYVGGMVRTMTPFWADGRNITARHHPGAIFLGRYWDAEDAAAGSWSEHNGYSTIVHEWGHYALFLHDEYLREDHKPASCSCPYAPFENKAVSKSCLNRQEGHETLIFSPMYYQYAFNDGSSATEFWHTTNLDSVSCKDTLQQFVHGRSDWDILGRWYKIQGVAEDLSFPASGLKVPIASPHEGPDGNIKLIEDLANFFVIQDEVRDTSNNLTQTDLPIPGLLDTAVPNEENAFPAQVYLLKEEDENGRTRIVYQGLYPTSGQARKLGEEEIVGVSPGDEVKFFVDRYGTKSADGFRSEYTSQVGQDGKLVDVVAPEELDGGWQASLDITYTVSITSIVAMNITVTSTNDLTTDPIAQLCVMDNEIGCHEDWQITMTEESDQPGVWRATIEALDEDEELPRYSLIRIYRPNNEGEIIRWIQVAGVGPIHGDADSPTRDGSIIVDTLQDIQIPPDDALNECYRMIVMPAANYTLLQIDLASLKEGSRIVGLPLEADIVMTDKTQNEVGEDEYRCRHFSANEKLPVELIYTLYYDANLIRDGASVKVFQLSPNVSPETEGTLIDVSPTNVTGLSLSYGAFGGNLNLDINGDFRNIGSFEDINGELVGGAEVTVVESENGVGTLTITGSISSFSIGGQELFIDNVCPITKQPENENPQCIGFEGPNVGQTYINGEMIPGTPITVESFANGEGFAQVVPAIDGECNCISGQLLEVDNVNLAFDLSTYRSALSVTSEDFIVGEPNITWISTAPTRYSGIFILVEQP